MSGDNRTNVWDSQNRLVSCATSGTGGNTSTFAYGADGLRRRFAVMNNGASTLSSITHYGYDGTNVVREWEEDPTTNINTIAATYLLGPNGPMYRRPANAADVKWYVYDGLGSVVGEVDVAGTMVAQKVHDVLWLRNHWIARLILLLSPAGSLKKTLLFFVISVKYFSKAGIITLKMNNNQGQVYRSKGFELVLDLSALTVMRFIQLMSVFRICAQIAMVLLVAQIASDVLVGPITSIVLHSLLLGLCKGIDLYCRQEASRAALLAEQAVATMTVE